MHHSPSLHQVPSPPPPLPPRCSPPLSCSLMRWWPSSWRHTDSRCHSLTSPRCTTRLSVPPTVSTPSAVKRWESPSRSYRISRYHLNTPFFMSTADVNSGSYVTWALLIFRSYLSLCLSLAEHRFYGYLHRNWNLLRLYPTVLLAS